MADKYGDVPKLCDLEIKFQCHTDSFLELWVKFLLPIYQVAT